MRIIGIDFTSSPKKGQPIAAAFGHLVDTHLHFDELKEWTNFDTFEAFLSSSGPWVAGLDFPFGQPKRFLENAKLPRDWAAYTHQLTSIDRDTFKARMEAYKAARVSGDKEHRRATDVKWGGASPMKTGFPAVGLMYHEGAGRLLQSGVFIPGLLAGDNQRICLETYPGGLARGLIGKTPYKQTKSHQRADSLNARNEILASLRRHSFTEATGLTCDTPRHLTIDKKGDHLDAWLCAISAAWAWLQKDNGWGLPDPFDASEGWIVCPELSSVKQTQS